MIKRMLWAVILLILFALPVSAEAVRLTTDKTTDLILLVDSSGSLDSVTSEATSALETLVELLPSRGYRTALIAYGNTWNSGYTFSSSELSDYNELLGDYARTRICLGSDLVNPIDMEPVIETRLNESRYTHGNNYLGGGLMASLDLLADSDDAAIIVLTDGRISGFDSTEGVEWKLTNRELVDAATTLAESMGVRIYSVELNTDSRNSSTSAERKLMSDLASMTSGKSYVVNQASGIKSAMIDIYADLTGADVTDSLSPALPTLTSEVSLVLDGDVNSITVGGKTYQKGDDNFTDNLFKLTSVSGKLNFKPSGGNVLKTVITEKLPLVLELSHPSPITKNDLLKINLYLGTMSNLDPVTDSLFYNDPLDLTIDGRSVNVEKSTSGWSTEYSFAEPGEYEITAKIGDRSVSTTIKVEDYGFKVEAKPLSEGETTTIRAYYTGVDGNLTDPTLYNNEGKLTVYRDGSVIDSELAMNSGEGYYLDYTAGEPGEYTFEVEAVQTSETTVHCGSYTLNTNWNPDAETLQKSDHVTLEATLISDSGEIIERSALERATLRAEKDGEFIENIPFTLEKGVLKADWRVSRAGNIRLILDVNGEESTLKFSSTNHAPVLLQDKFKAECHVGELITLKVTDYIGDADGDPFEITATGKSPSWADSSDEVNFTAGVISGDYSFTLTFSDGDESVELPCEISVKNDKPVRISELQLPHFILKAPGFMFFVDYNDEPVSFELNDYFSDPEGLPLSFSLESASSSAVLNGSTLKITPEKPENERLKLTITDSSGDKLTCELRLTIDEWWTLNLKRVLIAAGIAVAVMILCAIIVRRESNIGYLRVSAAKRGETDLDINEKLNRRRVRLWSLPLGKFIENRVGCPLPDEQGKITGHLIFGKKVKIKNITAAKIVGNAEYKPPKKLILRSGESVTLAFDDLQITITNRN